MNANVLQTPASGRLRASKLRDAALDIIGAGLAAVDPPRAVREKIGEYIPEGANNIHIVAVGKCSAAAASALEEKLGGKIAGGIVLDIAEPPRFRKLKYYRGTHPFPSRENKKASGEIIKLLEGLGENDFVLFVISGGGSSLLYNSDDISPEEEQCIVRRLFEKGADIEEINTVRKHISRARGGNLAKSAYPARSVSLIFSDVPSNELEFVASGPTVRDTTTADDARQALEKYGIFESCEVGGGFLLETPKEDKYFEKVSNVLFVSNKAALEAMKEKAEELGFSAEIRDVSVRGEAREVGESIARELHEGKPNTAVLCGGETTVTIEGSGKGGRNQELVLGALREIKEGELVAAVASDGWDNTDHAGALGDTLTLRHARELGLEPEKFLENNDSYAFFKKTGDAIVTGRLGSNVSDLIVALSGAPPANI